MERENTINQVKKKKINAAHEANNAETADAVTIFDLKVEASTYLPLKITVSTIFGS